MSDQFAVLRQRYLSKHLLTWTALRHFLPVAILRELAVTLVKRISGSQLQIKSLVSDITNTGPGWLDSWCLHLLDVHTPLENYLQLHIRAIAWNNDTETYVPDDLANHADYLMVSALENAARLGRVDLNCSEQQLSELKFPDEISYSLLIAAMSRARTLVGVSSTKDFVDAVIVPLLEIEGPLAAISIKHLGDLCADADQWDKASQMYITAWSLLEKQSDEIWVDLTSSLKSIVLQSRASALRTLLGPGIAADFLSGIMNSISTNELSLFMTNASFDTYVALSRANPLSFPIDRRSAVLLPPLLQVTQDRSSALESWLRGQFHDSQRQFWAVLRRQLALGLATESRHTKAFYARSILESLKEGLSKDHQPRLFRMAITLLLESGDSDVALRFEWNESLVEAYLDNDCVRFVVEHSEKHPGARIERQAVLLELFRQWIQFVALDHRDLSEIMLRHVGNLAIDSSSSFSKRENIVGRSLEIVHEAAQQRPELRTLIAPEVPRIIIERINSPLRWPDRTKIFEIAADFLDVLSREHQENLLRLILDELASIDAAAAAWPITRPALQALVSPSARECAKAVPEIGRRIIDTILRFGMQEQNDPARVLFNLYSFDDTLFREESIVNNLQEVVAEVRRRALQANSTATVGNIQALLLATSLSGREGIKDAIEALMRVLRSAHGPKVNLAFSDAYAPLLLLANERDNIAQNLGETPDEVKTWLTPLIPPIVDIWTYALDNPLLFAPFSIPPATTVNPTVVHNWAFATMLFAESLGVGAKVGAALNNAINHPSLHGPISLARATQSLVDDQSEVDPQLIRKESRDSFYAALGRRLGALHRMVDEERQCSLCEALLYQCLHQGPRDSDAAVLVSAARLNISISELERSDYVKRMGNNRNLRLMLEPILGMLQVRGR